MCVCVCVCVLVCVYINIHIEWNDEMILTNPHLFGATGRLRRVHEAHGSNRVGILRHNDGQGPKCSIRQSVARGQVVWLHVAAECHAPGFFAIFTPNLCVTIRS